MEMRIEQFNQQRPLLFSIAYRMLGSAMDAEDMVQETFLRWQQASDDDIQSPKAYLSTILTRLCIDDLRSAQKQREEYIGPWLPEPVLTTENTTMTDTLELAESLSMAFLVLLESLAPIERAVFLLREVFGYEYPEIARIVGKSETNCRQIASRAKEHIAAKRPRHGATREQQEEVTRRFIVACMSGDLQALLSVLAPDVVLEADSGGKVSAARKPIYGAAKVARAVLGILKLLPSDANVELARVNAQPAIIGYTEGRPFYVTVLDIAEGQIQGIYNVLNPDKLGHLPPQSPVPSV
ncbi:MAG TPA: RNA polymerase sigma-70 factor [Anaerolineae bacterium]